MAGLAGVEIPGKVAPPENWHITLRFLGTVDVVTYERFLGGLSPVGEVPAFRVSVEGLGAFPNPRNATVVWAGLGGGMAGLARLNEIAEEAARGAGLAAEERPFRPHLTLSRVRPPADTRHLDGSGPKVGWRCEEVVVYLSRTGSGGARYEPLETFPLAR
jgi:2'-5' RNA ligase